VSVPRFSYFDRLSATDKRIYIRSDELREVKIPDVDRLRPRVGELREALEAGKRVRTAKAANALVGALCKQLKAPPVRVRVREVRPSWESGELHGLYTFDQGDGEPPEIEVWMRTAAHKRVVRFKTFLRTLLHEVAHHLDATIYEMKESFHTHGFYARESHLVRQLYSDTESAAQTETETETEVEARTSTETETAVQLSLFDKPSLTGPRRSRSRAALAPPASARPR
jgi:putative component of toxin-antitoxin plasmid stabilization module